MPHVRYRYTVHGQTYEGSRISFAGRSFGTRGRAEEVADRYRSGSTIAVRCDPRNPAQATIETDKPSAFKIGFGIVFLALVLTIGHFAYTILQAF